MNPGTEMAAQAWPSAAAFIVGCLIPLRQSWLERLCIGFTALLCVAFIQGMWPGTASEMLPTQGSQLLNVLIFLPLVAAVVLLFLPRSGVRFLRAFTLGVLAVDFLISLLLLRGNMAEGWQYQYIAEWIPSFGIRYHVALDGLSFWLVLLTTLTTPIAAIVTFGSVSKRTKELCFSILLLHGGMLGAFLALDMFLFYVFWELMLIPMLILIGVWGGAERIKAAYKFFIFTMAGSVFMLAAILYMVWAHYDVTGYISFDYLALSRLLLPETAAYLCFAAFAIAFVIKVPMFPVHTWLPDAHVQAPTGGSIILAAVLLKLGTYAYIRFCMGMFAGPAYKVGASLAGVAVLGGILYGALVAWRQADVKKLIAYSSVAHLGFVMLGIFAATQSSLEGAILQMVNHGVTTGALFLLVGVIYDRRHTRLASEFGGLAKVMPIYTVIFIIVTMASIGVPGTNGFVGEFMIIMGTYGSQALGPNAAPQAVGAALGVILAAVYMLSVVQKVFFGPVTNPKNLKLPDINVRETIAVAPFIALVFVIGLFPNVFIERMSPTVTGIRDNYDAKRIEWIQKSRFVTGPVLIPRQGGPREQGYPERPDALASAQLRAHETMRSEFGGPRRPAGKAQQRAVLQYGEAAERGQPGWIGSPKPEVIVEWARMEASK